MDVREEVLKKIRERVGFNFEENELSPRLRRKINLLTQMKDEINLLYRLQQHLSYSKHNTLFLMMFLFSCGITLLILTPSLGGIASFLGVIFILCTYFVYKLKYERYLEALNRTKKEVAKQYMQFLLSIDDISEEIFNELSSAYEAKIMPKITHMTVDFADILELIKKDNIILKELSCPYCNAPLSLPEDGEWTICKYCGRRVYAINVLEQIKNILQK